MKAIRLTKVWFCADLAGLVAWREFALDLWKATPYIPRNFQAAWNENAQYYYRTRNEVHRLGGLG